MKPHQCPICLGRGKVTGNFYNFSEYVTSIPAEETCRSCQGTGIVWEQLIVTPNTIFLPLTEESTCTHSFINQINGGLEQCSICLKTWGGN